MKKLFKIILMTMSLIALFLVFNPITPVQASQCYDLYWESEGDGDCEFSGSDCWDSLLSTCHKKGNGNQQ